VVDGSESESGGFTGHPICEFCENLFYGDNELYLHLFVSSVRIFFMEIMSFTCICLLSILLATYAQGNPCIFPLKRLSCF